MKNKLDKLKRSLLGDSRRRIDAGGLRSSVDAPATEVAATYSGNRIQHSSRPIH